METKRERGPVNLYLRKDLIEQLRKSQQPLLEKRSPSAIVEWLLELYLDDKLTVR